MSVLCQWCYSIFITLYWHKAIHIQANGSFPGVLIRVLDEKWVWPLLHIFTAEIAVREESTWDFMKWCIMMHQMGRPSQKSHFLRELTYTPSENQISSGSGKLPTSKYSQHIQRALLWNLDLHLSTILSALECREEVFYCKCIWLYSSPVY